MGGATGSGSADTLTSRETISAFARTHGASLTVMDGGEHWFHTAEQMRFVDEKMQTGRKCAILCADFVNGGAVMTIEGYFDGTAVRPLEPVNLKPQQKVFIHIPNGDFSEAKNARIQKKLDAIHSVFSMLSDDESEAVDESISAGINFREVEV